MLSQLPKCIHNSIDAELKHGPFLLEHCHFKRKLIKYRILLNRFERFDWLNAITRFGRRTGVRFGCTLAPYKKCAKNCQLCAKRNFSICVYVCAHAHVYRYVCSSVCVCVCVCVCVFTKLLFTYIINSNHL